MALLGITFLYWKWTLIVFMTLILMDLYAIRCKLIEERIDIKTNKASEKELLSFSKIEILDYEQAKQLEHKPMKTIKNVFKKET